MKRIIDVTRMHTVAWPLVIAWPLAVLAIGFAISYLIFALIPETDQQFNFTGAILSLYGVALGFYAQAMTQTFPFALGISVTRREFFTATALIGLGQAVLLGTILQVLSVAEAATNGWGVKLRMFGVFRYLTDNAVVQWLALVATLLLTAAIGTFGGVVYQRFRVNGLLSLVVADIVVFGGAAVVISWQGWWGNVGRFLVDTPALLLTVAIPLAIALAFGAASWAGLRRASA